MIASDTAKGVAACFNDCIGTPHQRAKLLSPAARVCPPRGSTTIELRPHAEISTTPLARLRLFEEEPGRRSAAKLLTKDEARRSAVNILKLSELLKAYLLR